MASLKTNFNDEIMKLEKEFNQKMMELNKREEILDKKEKEITEKKCNLINDEKYCWESIEIINMESEALDNNEERLKTREICLENKNFYLDLDKVIPELILLEITEKMKKLEDKEKKLDKRSMELNIEEEDIKKRRDELNKSNVRLEEDKKILEERRKKLEIKKNNLDEKEKRLIMNTDLFKLKKNEFMTKLQEKDN